MQQQLSQEEREKHALFAWNFARIRPSLHIISKITGALFFILLAAKIGYLDWFYDNYPRATQILVAFIAYKAADYLEDKVSMGIANFAFAAVRWRQSWLMVLGSAIVLIPIFLISATTSYSGLQGNIDKGDMGLSEAKAEMGTIANIKSDNLKTLKAELKEYTSKRESDRKKTYR